MEIEALCLFKHDPGIYEAGKKYDVSEEDAQYFVNCGWAKAEGMEQTCPHVPDYVIIQPDNIEMDSEAIFGKLFKN